MSVLVVVRHANERSLPLCLAAIKKQTSNVKVVNVAPLIEAVRQTFLFGAQSDDKYTLAVDADAILRSNALREVLEFSEKSVENNPLLAYLEIYNKDKFRGPLTTGCQIFVNRYMELFYDYFRSYIHDPKVFRPESKRVFSFLQNFGLEWTTHKGDPIGYHDYEQYYLHLFIKYRNIAVKHVRNRAERRIELINLFEKLIKKNPDDLDYFVAYQGFQEGLSYTTVETDAGEYNNYLKFIKELGIQEKEPILPEKIDILLNKYQ